MLPPAASSARERCAAFRSGSEPLLTLRFLWERPEGFCILKFSARRWRGVKRFFIKANVLFCWQKRTRKPPAISTRWIHEKGAARPFQTPKGKSKPKNASRFAKRIFWASPVYGSADGVTLSLNFTFSKGVKSAAKQQIGETRKKCNSDDRRQWRKQGGAVGAAASRMRAVAKQTLGAATRLSAATSFFPFRLLLWAC